MSIDAITGKIIQNRVNDKINYQTSFTDFATFVEYCRYIKKIGPTESSQVNKVLGKRRSEFTPSWKNDKSDSHAKISLLQYKLIMLDNHEKYVISPLGEKFISLFNDANEIIAEKEEAFEVFFEMINAWHQEGNGFDIHPGRMILKLMFEPELHGYFTDQDLACICNNTDNRLDEQYDQIKEQVIAFRESGKVYTREEKKKTYTLLTGYANNWNIFILDEKSTNEIKIVRYTDEFKKIASKRLNHVVEDNAPNDEEFKEILESKVDYEVKIAEWEEKYGTGRILVEYESRVSKIQNAFRNRLISHYGQKCLLCNIRNKEMLVASHIKRDVDCESIEEKIDNNNGILLCANHDKVFDRYLMTFDFIDGSIKISESLSEEEREILGLDPKYVLPESIMNEAMQGYLVYHNEMFEKKELDRSAAV